MNIVFNFFLTLALLIIKFYFIILILCSWAIPVVGVYQWIKKRGN